LKPLGFGHDFAIDSARHRAGKWMFETYPHPSMVRLFDLDRIIRYKKGTVAQKREGLRILQSHLGRLKALVRSADLEALLEHDVATLKGRSLKHYEDQLDAVFCAYLAWHCWRWGPEKNDVFGSPTDGYIVVARKSAA
jgi:predicted RNase H-like nuclease